MDTRRIWRIPDCATDGAVLDSISRRPKGRNVGDTPGSASAVEICVRNADGLLDCRCTTQ
jgi:hypothetical protein